MQKKQINESINANQGMLTFEEWHPNFIVRGGGCDMN